jgi:hypothetical protein
MIITYSISQRSTYTGQDTRTATNSSIMHTRTCSITLLEVCRLQNKKLQEHSDQCQILALHANVY